jgi:hypothetical protein
MPNVCEKPRAGINARGKSTLASFTHAASYMYNLASELTTELDGTLVLCMICAHKYMDMTYVTTYIYNEELRTAACRIPQSRHLLLIYQFMPIRSQNVASRWHIRNYSYVSTISINIIGICSCYNNNGYYYINSASVYKWTKMNPQTSS